ncbi:fasciclin domain-containing protein [Lutimonas zeaxanthinifaciens]|uniref:fasciclin domain-containing protein n=1 Tax=Lutimonas zeaxanthinifaciens TaxID=3060215 RepID=UPI00265D5B5E|nr:fasciclin domain-containing protein [Lutimonas sp. YSD2104]WKK65557.1 fasciclin domain-containing protein [Lutimonas sp. YSD2104]
MKTRISLLALLLMFSFSSCKKAATENQGSSDAVTETKAPSGQAAVKDGDSDANALQVAKSLDDFSTLVAAIEAAGVEDAVVNVGPLTIFAPLNSGFDKLPEGTVETLVKPENKAKLAFILTNHVAPANYPINQLKKEARKGRKLYMASGKYLEVENRDGNIFVGGTQVLKTVQVSNGWIHVIDDVLVPAE